MIISLPNGKQVEIPTILFLEMDDEQWAAEMDDLMCKNMGSEQEDPFYLASFTLKEKGISNETDTLPEDYNPFNEIDFEFED